MLDSLNITEEEAQGLAELAQADAAAAAAEDAPRGRLGRAAIARRMQELRTALTRLAWDEAERPETEPDDAAPDGVVVRAGEPDYETFAGIHDEIDGLVTAECLRDSFCDAPLDDHVARVGSYLGFLPEAIARWRDLSDPPPAAFDHQPDLAWRSSA
jgi:hypothetical protein